ncbi:hypothetical protein Gotur_016622 [Gossypium turneri]
MKQVWSWDCVFTRGIIDPTTAEAIACLRAVNLAEDLGFGEVGIERDALTAVNFAEDLGFREVGIEGDALTVIKKIRWRKMTNRLLAILKKLDGGK